MLATFVKSPVPMRAQRNPSAQPMPEVTMADFKVGTEQRSGELVIRFSGELDLAAFDEADELLTTAQSDGYSAVRIDLRGLEFIDSSGIRLLLRAHRRAEERGDSFCIVRGNKRIQQVFALTDLDGRLPFCDDEP
jgi:anti-sigma B factor antagonist